MKMIEVETEHQYVRSPIRMMTFLRLWPVGKIDKGIAKFRPMILLLGIIGPITLGVFVDGIMIITEPDFDVMKLVESLIACTAVSAGIYMCTCFLNKKYDVQNLVERIPAFKQFTDIEGIIATDNRGDRYFRIFFVYYTVACISYVLMPFFSWKSCNAYRTPAQIKYGIPCGIVVQFRMPFKYNYSPLFELLTLNELVIVFMASGLWVTTTAVLCCIMLQALHNLQQLRIVLGRISESKNEKEFVQRTNFAVEYHKEIISFCLDMNEAFTSQMFVHITLTSFLISVLGYQLLHTNVADSIRFTLHLMGWIVLLFSLCWCGQQLENESTNVGAAAYDIKWYNLPISVQKNLTMIIMRSDKPLRLSAINLGFMNFATFLKIMKTAYSYFALLLNMQ